MPSVAPPLATVSAAWFHACLALALSSGVALLLYRDTVASMVAIWLRSDTFAHGFVIPLIVGWLAWQKRETLARQPPVPAYFAQALLLGSGLFWLLGTLASANSPAQFALVLMLALLVPAIAGIRITRILAFPLGFLFFAVPVGDFLLPQLMSATADFVVTALRFSGIPVYQVGQELVIPSGNWSVVEACSGIRYLIASLMIGTLYAYLNYRSLPRRIAFVVFAALVPILANWLRAYLIVMIGHLSSNRLATGVDHLVYGWVFFGLVMAIMFWVGSFWEEHDSPAPAQLMATPVPNGRPAAVWRACLLAIALLVLPRLAYFKAENAGMDLRAVHLPSMGVPGWQAQPAAFTSWIPAYENASDQICQTYVREGKSVGLYLGYYRNQSFSRKMVTSTNVLVRADNPEWKIIASGARAIRMAGEEVKANTTELASGHRDDKLQIWKWYWVGGLYTANDFLAKAYTAVLRLVGRGDDSAVIVLYTSGNPSVQGDALMESFLKDISGQLDSSLQKTRAQ